MEPQRPETDRIANPIAFALKLSGTACGVILLAGIGIAWRYRELLENAAWWIVPLLLVAVIAVCFSYSFLGASIGERKARDCFIAALFVALAIGLYALKRFTNTK